MELFWMIISIVVFIPIGIFIIGYLLLFLYQLILATIERARDYMMYGY